MGRAGRRGDGQAAARGYEPRADPHADSRRGRAPATGADAQAGAGRRGPRRAPDNCPVRRPAAPRIRRTGAPPQPVIAFLLLLLQAPAPADWRATPARPTVGDTIRLERVLETAPGWRVRAGKLEPASAAQAEPLGDPVVAQAANGWRVRYTVVAWVPGSLTLDMPPLWKLGPDGTADSLPGGTARFFVASVIPDSVRSPAPQPSIVPLRLERASAIPVLAAVLVVLASLWALIAWRRRAPRAVAATPPPPLDPDVADARWLAAGEPKAVAARAAHRLRHALAPALPHAPEALSTAECLAAAEPPRPNAPLRGVRGLPATPRQTPFATPPGR